MEVSRKIIENHYDFVREHGVQSAIKKITDETMRYARNKVSKSFTPNTNNPNNESTPIKLESFLYYLLRNYVDSEILEMALHEQYSLPVFDNDGAVSQTIRQTMESRLRERRSTHAKEASTLRQWHQAYHSFRVSANCFVDGVNAYLDQKYEESLDLFIMAYNISYKISNQLPEVCDNLNSKFDRYTALTLFF